MNYTELKSQVLKLLNQYSVAGKQVASSYNNQQDYLSRIASLANDAIMEIATTGRKIPATISLGTLEREDLGQMSRYELPENFYQFKTGSTMVTTNEGEVLHTNLYSLDGKKYLLIPNRELEDGKSYSLTYYRYPTLLSAKPDDTDELDNEPETHVAVAFYVAAFLVIHDDNFLYASFYNKYEDKLQKMGAGYSAEVIAADDLYPTACSGDAYGY